MVKATELKDEVIVVEFDYLLQNEEERVEDLDQEEEDYDPIPALVEKNPDISFDIIQKLVSSFIMLNNISEKHDTDYIQILIGITNIPEDQIRRVIQDYQDLIDQMDVERGFQIDQIKDHLDEADHPYVKRVLTKWWNIELMIEDKDTGVDVNLILFQMLNNVSEEVIGRIMYYYFEIFRVTELRNEGYQEDIIPL